MPTLLIKEFIDKMMETPAIVDALRANHASEDYINNLNMLRRDPSLVVFSPRSLFDAQTAHNNSIKEYITAETDGDKQAVLDQVESIF